MSVGIHVEIEFFLDLVTKIIFYRTRTALMLRAVLIVWVLLIEVLLRTRMVLLLLLCFILLIIIVRTVVNLVFVPLDYLAIVLV
jgi:hypothetical protein